MPGIDYYECERREIFTYIPNNVKKVLEVGCACGLFGKLLKKEYGAEVWGIELSTEACNVAKSNIDRVINAKIEDAMELLTAGYFDCVIFNDVLEHLIDPWNVLDKIKKYLSKDAVVIASIPNFRFWGNLYQIAVKGDFEYKDKGILDRTHLRFFTYKSILKMFGDCGYAVRRIDGINASKRWISRSVFVGPVKDLKYPQFVVVAGRAK